VTEKLKAKDFTPAYTIELIKNGIEGAKYWLSQGVTTIRNVCDEFDFDIGLRDLIAQGKIEGPRIFASGKPIMMPGRPLYHGIGHEVSSPAEARRAAREQLRAGADIIKLFASAGVGGAYGNMVGEAGWEQLTVEEMQAATFEAHKAGRTVTAHAHHPQSIKNCVLAGLDSVEHAHFVDEEGIAMMKERDVVMVPTLAVAEVLMKGTQFGHPPHMEKNARLALEKGIEGVVMAREAGVRIAVGTDPGHGETIAMEFVSLHKAGMTPMEIIVGATKTGAELVKMGDQLGTLEEGKIADLIVLEGNPLEDIKTIENVRWVVKEGEIVKSHQ
jgi:imidazolonepropionase-like amidohydrolase